MITETDGWIANRDCGGILQNIHLPLVKKQQAHRNFTDYHIF